MERQAVQDSPSAVSGQVSLEGAVDLCRIPCQVFLLENSMRTWKLYENEFYRNLVEILFKPCFLTRTKSGLGVER